MCEWVLELSADDNDNVDMMRSTCGQNVLDLTVEVEVEVEVEEGGEVSGIVADWCAQTCAKVEVDPIGCRGKVVADVQQNGDASGCLEEDTQEQEQEQEETNNEPSEEGDNTIDGSSDEEEPNDNVGGDDTIKCQDNSEWTRESRQGDYMNCVWVARRKTTRCQRDDARENCPGTCHEQCPDNSVTSVGEEEDEEPILCQDNSEWTRRTSNQGNNYMNCDWVGKKSPETTKHRCRMNDALENCPGTCHEQCPDSVNWVGE